MNYIPETQEYTMNQAWNQHGNMAAQVKSASYEDGGGYPGGSFSPTNIGISAFGVNLLL
jgi:hypothetical protein